MTNQHYPFPALVGLSFPQGICDIAPSCSSFCRFFEEGQSLKATSLCTMRMDFRFKSLSIVADSLAGMTNQPCAGKEDMSAS